MQRQCDVMMHPEMGPSLVSLPSRGYTCDVESITETLPSNTRIHLGFTMLALGFTMCFHFSLLRFYHPCGWMSFKLCYMRRLFIHRALIRRFGTSALKPRPAPPPPPPIPGQRGGRWMVISNGEREEDEERGRVLYSQNLPDYFFPLLRECCCCCCCIMGL